MSAWAIFPQDRMTVDHGETGWSNLPIELALIVGGHPTDSVVTKQTPLQAFSP
jgi:hypothetical protein